MGILPIAEAQHQPGITGESLFTRPGDPSANSGRDCSIGCNIKTVSSSQTGQSRQVFECGQIMVAGTTDPLDPATLS